MTFREIDDKKLLRDFLEFLFKTQLEWNTDSNEFLISPEKIREYIDRYIERRKDETKRPTK